MSPASTGSLEPLTKSSASQPFSAGSFSSHPELKLAAFGQPRFSEAQGEGKGFSQPQRSFYKTCNHSEKGHSTYLRCPSKVQFSLIMSYPEEVASYRDDILYGQEVDEKVTDNIP